MEPKHPLPNSAAALTLGICSIVFSCCGVGLVLGIIGIVLAVKSKKIHEQNPGIYDGYGALMGGLITSIIGVSLGAIWLFFVILQWLINGVVFSINNFMNQ